MLAVLLGSLYIFADRLHEILIFSHLLQHPLDSVNIE